MKNVLKISLFLICITILFACSKEDKTVSKTESLSYFDEIEVNDVFDVYLTQDSIREITVEADKNTIEKVKFRVENGVLILENELKGKWIKPKKNKVKLYISVDSLKTVWANETSYIESLNPLKGKEIGIVFSGKLGDANLELDCETFFTWNNHPCGGKLVLSGKVKQLKIWGSAIMTFDANNLISENALVENKSKGDCKVNVTNTLEYSINGEGNIHLSGNPISILEKESTGSGKLIRE